MVGYGLGLAVLVPLSAARTDSVAGDVEHPPDAALVEGFRWAFYAGAALAVLGTLAANAALAWMSCAMIVSARLLPSRSSFKMGRR